MIYQHILVAVDLDHQSSEVVSKAAELAKRFDATLNLLFVEPGIGHQSFMEVELPTLTEQSNSLKTEHQKKLSQLARNSGYAIQHEFIRTGDIAQCVTETAAEIGADLVICGEHHGFWHISHSDRAIIKQVGCDVLLLKL